MSVYMKEMPAVYKKDIEFITAMSELLETEWALTGKVTQNSKQCLMLN